MKEKCKVGFGGLRGGAGGGGGGIDAFVMNRNDIKINVLSCDSVAIDL